MDAENALVVQIISQLADRLVKAVELGPVDRIEEDRAEEALAELGAGIRGDVIGQELGADVAKRLRVRCKEALDGRLVKVSHMAAEGFGVHDIAADEMPLVPAAPLQIEEVVAMEREGPQQHHVS